MSLQNPKNVSASEKLDCGICGAHVEGTMHYYFWSTVVEDLYAFCGICFEEVAASKVQQITIEADYHAVNILEVTDGE